MEIRNRLLMDLKSRDLDRVVVSGTMVELRRGQWLTEVGLPMRHVYFPFSGVCSAVASAAERQVEVGTIGNEGLVGIPALLDDGLGLTELQVLVPGEALRLDVEQFQKLTAELGDLRARLLRYAQAFLGLIAQCSACHALHTVEQQCARWLLMTHDRLETDRLPLSQATLARMLGVRRPTVTLATAGIKQAGAARFLHGRVVILDREALREHACECYGIVAAEFDRLIGPAAPPAA